MADALVGTTIQVVLEKVLSLALDRIGLALGFKEELQRLKDSAEMIEKLLADAEDKQSESKAVQLWLKRLQGVVYDTYYVLDELNYQVLRRKVKSRDQLKGKVCTFFFLSKDDMSFRWRMASKVRDINLKLEKINTDAGQYGLNQKAAPTLLLPSTEAATNRQTTSIVAPIVVGRENDESNIVKMLLSPSEKVVSVISIVGMGGLGKTTLAKSVYNNQQIDGHFNKKIWVCVSEKFEGMELSKQILESLSRKKVEILSNLDAVVQEIRDELDGKRYLLVLDDVWNENPDLWETFFNSLVGISTASGSKCLVTTRLHTTASIVSRHPPYELSKLSDNECWSIIKEKLMESGEIPDELIGIRSHVVKKCDGLPLAANVIGGLLCRFGKHEWQSVVEKKLLNIGSTIEQILKLSFDNLPSPSIKKCFAYCSLFDKDAKLKRDRLIKLWMAEGFLQSDVQDERLMEETGEECFSILLQSSLLEKGEGLTFCYKMHDLVHDLAQSISNSENDSTHQVRHLALDMDRERTLHDASPLILKCSSISNEMLWTYKRLHILNLSQAEITELPTSIGKLKHLRFLDVSKNKIKSLPEPICKLYNLQTLYVDSIYLEGLPQGMSNLISLRHLHYDSSRIQMPREMRRLTCLQTLQFYNIGEEKGCQIEELGGLTFLKGRLDIRNLELVKSKEEAERANLSGKQNLTGLCFSWEERRDGEGVAIYDEQVLEGLKPHQNLEGLAIWSPYRVHGLLFNGESISWFLSLKYLDGSSF